MILKETQPDALADEVHEQLHQLDVIKALSSDYYGLFLETLISLFQADLVASQEDAAQDADPTPNDVENPLAKSFVEGFRDGRH